MKIFFIYKFPIDTKSSGGNKFLKNLYERLNNDGYITLDPSLADIFLYNAHHFPDDVKNYRKKYSDKIFIHRVDGVYDLYNKPNDPRQKIAYELNLLSTHCFYQSLWSRKILVDDYKFSMGRILYNFPGKEFKNRKTITNNNTIVYYNEYKKQIKIVYRKKPSVILSSWSTNKNKGFKYFNVFFEKYKDIFDYTYVGNVPNDYIFPSYVVVKPAMNSEDLSIEYQNHDFYYNFSKYECCSNSLLEAAASGLQCFVLNKHGNGELSRIYNNIKTIDEFTYEIHTKTYYSIDRYDTYQSFINYFLTAQMGNFGSISWLKGV